MSPTRAQIEDAIRYSCEAHELDTNIVIRQCAAESNFDQSARSSCGAIGLFQLLPATAHELGCNPEVWQENVAGGVKYLAWLLRHYWGAYDKALAAYNWGIGHLDKLLREHPEDWREHLPQETARYLEKIL